MKNEESMKRVCDFLAETGFSFIALHDGLSREEVKNLVMNPGGLRIFVSTDKYADEIYFVITESSGIINYDVPSGDLHKKIRTRIPQTNFKISRRS